MAHGVITIQVATKEISPDSVEYMTGARSAGQTLQNILPRLKRYLNAIPSRGGKLAMRVDSATPSTTQGALDDVTFTITLTQASIANDETDTILGQVFTWKTSASGETEVTIGGDDDTAAANLNAKINAYTGFLGLVSSTVASNVVTVTVSSPGRVGSLLRNVADSGGAAFSAASAAVTGITWAQESATLTFGTE